MPSLTAISEKLGINYRFFDAILNLLNFGRVQQKEPGQLRRFLILQYDNDALGVAINATPLVEALKQAFPDAYIGMATSRLSYQVFYANPYLNEIYYTPHPGETFFKTLVYYIKHMRRWRRSFDCVLTDSFNSHTKITALQIATGVPLRVGYANRSGWLHLPASFPAELSIRVRTSVIASNLRVLEPFGIFKNQIEPKMFFNEEDRRFVNDLLRHKGMPQEGPLIVIVTQNSGRQPAIWHDDRFAKTADQLSLDYQARIAFTGTAGDFEKIEKIRVQMQTASYNLAGETNVAQLSALLCGADLMLTLDTGVMHVGRAVGVPMVVLSSPWESPEQWLPLNFEKYKIIRRDDISCALCWKPDCATRECMDEITVEDVLKAVASQLSRFPATISAREFRLNDATNPHRLHQNTSAARLRP